MNSFPMISHRLFVEAVGNESHANARPARLEKPPVTFPEQATMIALETADKAATIRDGFRPLQVTAAQPRV
jgi:hypothetical protein